MKGFTLVEMLVALAALSLLAGGGILVTEVALDARTGIEASDTRNRELIRLHTLLKTDLSQAAARRARAQSGEKPQSALLGPPYISGDVFLSFVRRGWDNISDDRRSSLQYVEYALRGGEIQRSFRRRVDGAPAEAPQTLLKGVRDVRVSYFQYDQWAEGWAGSPASPLPRAVALEFQFQDGARLRQVFLLPEYAT